jgi:hypothetical protein
MGLTKQAASAVQKCVDWLTVTQNEQGAWTGALRSTYSIWYAAGLALDGEPWNSAGIGDICQYVESCVCEDGGSSPYPGEPSTGFDTAMAIPLLTWARRDPGIIRKSREYLKKHGENFADPIILFMRWVFEPECRKRIGRDRGPNRFVLRALLRVSRRHPTVRWKLRERHPRCYQSSSWPIRKLWAFLLRAWTYPHPGLLEEGLRVSPHPVGFDTMLFVTAGIRRVAKDTSADAQVLIDCALERRGRFAGLYRYDWLSPLVADMFFTQAMGMEEEYAKAAAAFRHIRNKGKGWLCGTPISMNIFDTALTLQALHGAGISSEEPFVQRACDFLLAARRGSDGLWSWQYDRECTEPPGNPDSDDSGAACVALAQSGKANARELVKDSARALTRLQELDGSFSTYGGGVLRPNWCCVSNTSRATQALILSGLNRSGKAVERALQWLRSQQMPDGSWVDGWCARYIYGTAMAMEALMLAETDVQDPAIQRARDWLLAAQNSDGGWGENWHGGRSHSTSEHTGLALRALCLIEGSSLDLPDVIEAGVNWLVGTQRADGAWDSSYFVDFGFGSGFADSQLPVVWALHGLGSAIRVLEGSAALAGNNRTHSNER